MRDISYDYDYSVPRQESVYIYQVQNHVNSQSIKLLDKT